MLIEIYSQKNNGTYAYRIEEEMQNETKREKSRTGSSFKCIMQNSFVVYKHTSIASLI